MKSDLRKTKIIGTIGPASDSEEMLTKLMNAGLNVCRINFSHGGYEENAEKIATIKRCREKLNLPIAMALDTKGPEIRTGKLESGDEKVTIEKGQEFTFVHDDIIGNNTKTTLSYKELYKDVKPGSTILVDDGTIEFKVKEINGQDIVCIAQNTGKLGSRKTMNIPGVVVELPALGEKDIDDITKGVKAGFDYIFASFIRRPDDVRQIRKLLDDNGGQDIKIISKIESQEGVENIEEILKLSDGIMVARGDMGVEIPMEDVPVVQKRFIRLCNNTGKPVITATQMLESMTHSPRPTRAEVSDVANAVYDRSSCIMLSGECASGEYPVECVEAMSTIAKHIEKNIKYWKRFDNRVLELDKNDLEFNVAYTAGKTARNMMADAIVAYTHTGRTANLLSAIGPACPILVVTDNEKVYNQLSIVWNVFPVLVKDETNIDLIIEKGIEKHKELGNLEAGDSVILAGGSKVLPDYPASKVFGGYLKIQ